MWIASLYSILSSFVVMSEKAFDDVVKERNDLLRAGSEMMLGSDIKLSESELKANKIIMDLKTRELEEGFQNPHVFNFSKHFFEYKDDVKDTKLFKIIQKMPKGAILHAHDTGILGPDYVLKITYMENLYVCFDGDNLKLVFAKSKPVSTCGAQWQLMEDARNSSGDVGKFDAELRKHFTIVIDDPKEQHTDINRVWSKFASYFITSSPLLCYKPVWEQYFYDSLQAFRNDGIMFLELRSILPSLYDLEGNVYDSLATAESYKRVVDKFVSSYPDFYGAKLIYAPLRIVDVETVKEYIKIAKEIKKKMPDFFAGFDLVGQEDLGVPTKEFLRELVEAKESMDYFFHAGETNWNGMSSDENLVDAIVLGTKRIGHGYALIKHPHLIKEIVKRDIAIEVNVISNTVLKLVEDVRNHPLASYLAQGLPVVLSSDDPGLWGAEPISHDFYVTFLGVASKHADLRILKKLAFNSLHYSTFKDKDKIMRDFEIRWAKFIDLVVKGECKCNLLEETLSKTNI